MTQLPCMHSFVASVLHQILFWAIGARKMRQMGHVRLSSAFSIQHT